MGLYLALLDCAKLDYHMDLQCQRCQPCFQQSVLFNLILRRLHIWHTDYHWMNKKKRKSLLTSPSGPPIGRSRRHPGRHGPRQAAHITSGVLSMTRPGIKNDFMEWAETWHLSDRLPASPYRRNQWRCPLEKHPFPPPSCGTGHRRQIDLGPWQQIFYAEFDGQRRKRLLIKVGRITPELCMAGNGFWALPGWRGPRQSGLLLLFPTSSFMKSTLPAAEISFPAFPDRYGARFNDYPPTNIYGSSASGLP